MVKKEAQGPSNTKVKKVNKMETKNGKEKVKKSQNSNGAKLETASKDKYLILTNKKRKLDDKENSTGSIIDKYYRLVFMK